ncbi:MAG: hypothetical protein Q9167_006420 [Letrouitia subvulpina]
MKLTTSPADPKVAYYLRPTYCVTTIVAQEKITMISTTFHSLQLIIQEALGRVTSSSALQHRGKLFSIPAVGKYVVFLSTQEQVDEASRAPIDQLSFNAAIDEQFLPHLIFHGFKFDPKDPRYSVPLHAMRVDLRDHLQALTPSLLRSLNKAFQSELADDKCTNGTAATSRSPKPVGLLTEMRRLD